MPTLPGPAASRLRHLPSPRALLFDLDGTLVDTVGIRVAAWVQTFAELEIDVDVTALPLLMGADGHHVAREAARTRGRVIDDALAEKVDHRAGEHYDRLNKAPAPLPGAHALFDGLARSSLRYAIATSSRAGQVLASVAALALHPAPPIVDGSHVRHAKPAPDLLLLAARRLGSEPADCWYVGDSIWDMQAGRAAGMVALGVTTGFADADRLHQGGASAVADGLPELHLELARRVLVPRPDDPAPARRGHRHPTAG